MPEQIDPHWQNDERPVRVTARASSPAPVQQPAAKAQPQVVSVSRRPAAIAGILLAGGILLSVYGAGDLLKGALPSDAPAAGSTGALVTITDKGFVPPSVTLHPGDTLTWQNNAAIPYLLSSDTLKTTDGPLQTSAIFTGATLSVTVAADATPGSYNYISLTSAFSGTVIVTTGDTATSSSASSQKKTPKSSSSHSSAAVTDNTSSDFSSQTEIAQIPAPAEDLTQTVSSSSSSAAAMMMQSSSVVIPPFDPTAGQNPFPAQVQQPQVPVIPTTPLGMVPRNPYAIGNTAGSPFPVQQPASEGKSSSSKASHSSSLHSGAPLQKHLPKTGPGEWVAVFAALAALALVTASAMRKQAYS